MKIAGVNIGWRDVAGYALLPRVVPRLYGIGIHFHFVAALMAQLFAWVGLLPPGHPYLHSRQAGQFSVRQVFITAAYNLKFTRTHIDQVIIFFLLVAAFALLVIQCGLMALYLVLGVAHASMFATADPTNDIAFILLDRVFGVPNFFNSCIATAQPCDPTSNYLTPYEPAAFPEPMQIALQALFGYYSMGMLLVGGAIVAYFILVVILESAQSGVPFGTRFASVYAPIRLCLAVLMLVPLPMQGGYMGFNGAQYLTLYMAKVGSSMGTNMWITFNNYFVMGGAGVGPTLDKGYGVLNVMSNGSADNRPAAALVARPKPADIDPLVQFMFLAHACRAMYEQNPPGERKKDENGKPMQVMAYIDSLDYYIEDVDETVTYQDALELSNNGTIIIRFGLRNPENDIIDPVCGELQMSVGSLGSKQPGPTYLMERHFAMTMAMWANPEIKRFGDRMAQILLPTASPRPCDVPIEDEAAWGTADDACENFPDPEFYVNIRDTYQALITANTDTAREKQINATQSAIDPRILSRGWAGAGIWYNRLAQITGALFEAARAIPEVTYLPRPMETVLKQRKSELERVSAEKRYTPAGKDRAQVSTPLKEIASGLNQIYRYFQDNKLGAPIPAASSGGAVIDLMNTLFGTKPLFDMRQSTDIHPLVQMIALGKSIIDHCLRNLLYAGGLEFVGGVVGQLDSSKAYAEGILNISDAWFTVALLGLGIGIMLYYVIPFLPFIYFFFSVIKWLQSVFEAMVGMPLWALAHLRIDGDGIPGEAAADGYYLVFEIFLRPALTIFGMIASYVIFTAMVFTLNDVYDVVAYNLGGNDPGVPNPEIKRGIIDDFFFAVLYAVLVYIIATSCFKLIDMIPAQILRWMGSSAKNIIDETGDPVPDLIRSTYLGAFGMHIVQKAEGSMIGQAVEGMQQGVRGLGEMTGQGLNSAMKKKP